MDELKPGLCGRAETKVVASNTALHMGSGSLPVFATPALLALMEEAAASSVQPLLESGVTTVGTRIELKHLAASPLGANIVAESELTEIDRRRLCFTVRAWDGDRLIGEGVHERFLVQAERFMEKALQRSSP